MKRGRERERRKGRDRGRGRGERKKEEREREGGKEGNSDGCFYSVNTTGVAAAIDVTVRNATYTCFDSLYGA